MCLLYFEFLLTPRSKFLADVALKVQAEGYHLVRQLKRELPIRATGHFGGLVVPMKRLFFLRLTVWAIFKWLRFQHPDEGFLLLGIQEHVVDVFGVTKETDSNAQCIGFLTPGEKIAPVVDVQIDLLTKRMLGSSVGNVLIFGTICFGNQFQNLAVGQRRSFLCIVQCTGKFFSVHIFLSRNVEVASLFDPKKD